MLMERKARQVILDPAWPAHEHVNGGMRGRGPALFISQSSWPASCSNLPGLQSDFQVPDWGPGIQMLSPVKSD